MKQLVDKVRGILQELKDLDVKTLVEYDVKNVWADDLVKDTVKLMAEKANSQLELQGKDISSIEKMCCYKISEMKVDCDVSLRSVVIYCLAFGQDDWKIRIQDGTKEKYEIYSIDKKETVYCGDTMNSYGTTVHEFLRSYPEYDKENDKFVEKTKYNKYGVSNTENGEKYGYFANKNFFKTHWEACILDHYARFKEIMPTELEDFAKLTHTVGNFIHVPAGFNARGLSCDIKDYWDLTLLVIWQWFLSEEKQYRDNALLSKIVQDKVGTYGRVTNCVRWLETYNDWNDFVEKNFLQDFVNGDSKSGKYGGPKMLWDSHSFNHILPNSENEFAAFFKNSTDWIKKRGEEIIKVVQEKLKNKSAEGLDELARGIVPSDII